MESILSIDCGTQSIRALLFSKQGEMLKRVQIEYEPYVSHHPGWAEQDPELYWNTLVSACRQLKESDPLLFDNIKGVGVTTQRASMINVDENGRVLRPAILWMDQRSAAPVWGQKGLIRMGLSLLRLNKKIKDIQVQGKCNWIMQKQPDIWKQTYKYLQISGFLNYRLTGNFTDSIASQIGHIPFDYKQQRWAGSFQLAKKLFPIDVKKLPKLIAAGDLLGNISAKASAVSGLKTGIPVIACGSDKGCETLGAGVTKAGMASLSFGTTATVQIVSKKYVEPIRYMPPYPAVIPSQYNPEVEIFRGFWMISWFKKQFAHKEVQKAKKLGISAEEVLNKCLAKTQPGAMGLMVQPYWGQGLDHPDAKGAMIGFGDVHTKDHVYRAVIEGLGFALLEGMQRIEAKTGVKIKMAAVSGGASQSDEICQIFADIFNIPMTKGQTHETSGLGAAIITANGIGWFDSVKEASKKMVHSKTVFQPNLEHVKIYSQLYTRVYKRMYGSLKPLYANIKEITGYPKT